MNDRNGAPLVVGSRVRFRAETRGGAWIVGTIRKIWLSPSLYWEARVDDGDPLDADGETNGWTLSAFCTERDIEKMEDQMLNLTPIEARHDARESNTETDADVTALLKEVYRLRRSLALAATCVRLEASRREHDPVLLGLAGAIEQDGYGDRNPTRGA